MHYSRKEYAPMLSTVFANAFILATLLGSVHPRVQPVTSTRYTPPNFSSHTNRDRRFSIEGVLTVEEQEFIDRINVERTEQGLGALTPDRQLIQVARAHSRDMCVRDYFSHIAPIARLRSPLDRYVCDLYSEGLPIPNHLTIGENIYYCSSTQGGDDVADADRAFMNSPEHRANILNPNFDRIGVGIWRDAKGQLWVTETFLRDTD
jgi:uncharacterized protein YkwD